MAIEAVYFDGETARESRVAVSLEPSGLYFSGDEVPCQTWSLSDLSATNPPQIGKTLRLSHESHMGARLSIRNDAFMRQLLIAAPHLKGGFHPKRTLGVVLWVCGGLVLLAGLIYLALNFAPQRLAVLLPDAWSKRVGEQMEASLVRNARVCRTPDGNKAIAAMLATLADGTPDIPPLRVRVYDIPIMNAFALPGGYVVLTRGLLSEASEPGEVAGVLAHEVGHVAYHHPEQQMIRIAGMQVLISVATGTSGGNDASSLAGLAAILKSSRDAEREADAFAVAMLSAARIDPMAMKHFLEKILKEEGKFSGGVFSHLGTVFSTHPITTERIAQIKPSPAGVALRSLLSDEQWKDLKAICG
jgi:Zn-dependent protease with chaperone function